MVVKFRGGYSRLFCRYSSQPSLYELLHLKEKIRQDYRDDIRDIDRLSQAMADFQPEIVFHLAAQPIVRTSLAEPKLTFDVNLGEQLIY